MNWKIPLFKTYSDENDLKSVSTIIKRGTYWAAGPEIEEFEERIAKYIGVKHALVFNSGTSALHALLLAYNVEGEVIVPSFTFVSTANTVVLANAKPVFAEIEEDTLGLDYEDVKKKINDKTKAVIIVHYAGCPAKDTEKIRKLCQEKNILFLEDAAESMGATINGKGTGSLGDAGILSFCQNKIISTGEGGAVTTNSEELYNKLKLIRSHGRKNDDHFSSDKDSDYIELGHNFRMPTMCAALGLSQIKKIDELIEKREKHANYYNKELGKFTNVPIPPKNFSHVYQLYTIVLDSVEQREKLQNFLQKKGIMSKIYFDPAHLKTFYKKKYGCKEGDLPKTEGLSKRVLSLPIYVDMNDNLKLIISNIKEFFEGVSK